MWFLVVCFLKPCNLHAILTRALQMQNFTASFWNIRDLDEDFVPENVLQNNEIAARDAPSRANCDDACHAARGAAFQGW